ncbi:MAG: GNAT family N-acetyltransferase [Chloroflexota bacterium]
MSNSLIHQLESLSFNAWPAALVRLVDGWRVRYNWQVTRRANSAWPNESHKRLELATKLAWVEEFYRQWNCRVRYQICPASVPANLDDILAERGYTSQARTAVQTAAVATVLSRALPNPAFKVTITGGVSQAWLATYRQIEQLSKPAAEIRLSILQRIRPCSGYALVQAGGRPVAVGLAVAEQGWCGIFCMATQVDFRRQRAAATILHSLAGWSQEQGATQLYLQVMENNEPAQALYGRAGFETVYHYHYRESPAG